MKGNGTVRRTEGVKGMPEAKRGQPAAIGLDIGTTSAKAVVYSPEGRVLGLHESAYPLLKPHPSWAEQDPEVILRATVDSLALSMHKARIGADDVLAIGVSSAMHSLIVMDEEHRPLTRSITWADSRSTRQARRLKEELEGHFVYLRTGTPIHPMSPLAKLLWLREEAPDIFGRAAKFIGIKEYVLHRLFGKYVVDYSVASTTGLFNLERLDWDEEALKLCGVSREQLSDPVPATRIISGMEPAYALRLGLRPDTPWVVGASDGVLANVGAGATEPGVAAVTIGTSGAIRMVADKPVTDPLGRTFCYALTPGMWVIGGATNNGGIALQWLREELGCGKSGGTPGAASGSGQLEGMLHEAAAVPAGAEGLLFLPFLTGERAPWWNADFRGVFFGMSLRHSRPHLIRAVLEGVVFAICSVSTVLGGLTGAPHTVRASGGFARSPLWRQIVADVLLCELEVPESHEASAMGAAAVALLAVGGISSLKQAGEWIRIAHRHQPDLSAHRVYRDMHGLYEGLCSKLAPEFQAITELQRRLWQAPAE